MADRVCTRIKRGEDPLGQTQEILQYLRLKVGSVFAPEVMDALEAISEQEYIWLELHYNTPLDAGPLGAAEHQLDARDVLSLSRMFSRIIDFRSRYTATHSAGVASVAEKLAEIAGFSDMECLHMRIAGYLHDLGKIVIDSAVLEKPGKLTQAEYNVIRSHTFLTYHLLGRIKGFETIRRWAAFHHERLDGKGYPFHLSAPNISIGARIMAVADVFSSLTEERPYRAGMTKERTVETLCAMVRDGALNDHITTLALDNIDLLRLTCKESRAKAEEEYRRFFEEEDFA